MKPAYQQILIEARSRKPQIKATIKRLRKVKPKTLDHQFHQLHEEAFEEVDCLQCANCCSTTSPIFTMSDIERLAKHLKLKPQQFIDEFLKVDDEGDHVLQSSPCAFLGVDNYCSVYEHRPKACREYPHTNRKRMHQILKLTEKNAQVCPAVYRIVGKLENII
ncbi:MAG: YkgJ family cysteine cluster protein [Cyclobacteriaceae bacterium]